MGVQESLKARRAAARWLRASARVLEEAVQGDERISPSDHKELLEHLLADFEKSLETWESAQRQVEVEIDEESLDADIDEATVFRSRMNVAKRAALKELRACNVHVPAVAGPSAPSTAVSDLTRLPKLDLPRFGGNVAEWTSFWEQFNNAVDATELPEVSKFVYLRTLLHGDAARCIEGLSLTARHYADAVALLKERFGRRELIVVSHVQSLLNMKATEDNTSTLRMLFDSLQTHVRSLQGLDITGEQYGVFLNPIILSKLPNVIRLEWARHCEKKESDLEFLLSFIKKEIETRERSAVFVRPPADPAAKEKSQPRSKSTVSALQAPSRAACSVCRGAHRTEKCFQLTKVPLKDRRQVVLDARLCFACFSPDHRVDGCQVRCSECRQQHHRLLCTASTRQQSSLPANGPDPLTPTPALAVAPGSCSASLQTARVSVVCPDGRRVKATALMDSGADRSFVSAALVQRVKPTFLSRTKVNYVPFGSNNSSFLNSYVFDLKLCRETDGMVHAHDVECNFPFTEVPTICAPIRRQMIPSHELRKLGGLSLSDRFSCARQIQIDLLIGMDHYWKVMNGDVIRLSNGLVAQESMFGWVVSGSYLNQPSPQCEVSAFSSLLCMDEHADSLVRALWELDSIGIAAQEHGAGEEDAIMREFDRTVRYDGERYEVSLPWNGKQHELCENRREAEVRFEGLQRKLRRNPALLAGYDDALSEFEKLGFVEAVVPSDAVKGPVFYLPHRPVVRETSATTKIRPVFDASARGANGISLNDCLYAGPSLLPSMVDVLLRFRRHAVALTAGISKAFLQIRVRSEDRDVHRYITQDGDGTHRVFRFERVPFGNKSSPFLLNATVRHHLALQRPSAAVKELKENLYVDDWLSGADSAEEASLMFAEARETMAKAGMKLCKWNSNERDLLRVINQSTGDHVVSATGSILGIRWLPEGDSFGFHGFEVPIDMQPTKRVVLSCVARMYDPLGFAAPFVMQAKILFQDIWHLGLTWDEPLPSEQAQAFTSWLIGLRSLRAWRIPRRFSAQASWSQLNYVEIHAFCDASERGYGTVVYLRISNDDSFSSSLIMARARVAPVKKVTLPRLELLGALLAARLVATVVKALHLSESTPICCWTDSMVSLGWIKGDPCRWKPFVANRVREIQELVDPACWRHVPGSQNPADLLTRGVSADALMQDPMWLKGPDFERLKLNEPRVDSAAVVTTLDELCLATSSQSPPVSEAVLNFTRFSSLIKLQRSTAWVLRFIKNLRSAAADRRKGELCSVELKDAERMLYKQTQREAFAEEIDRLSSGLPVAKRSSLVRLSPFLDEEGIMRMKGRLQKSNLTHDAKHPIILPNGPLAKLLIRSDHVSMKHAGVGAMMAHVRASHWVIGLRRLVKRVKRECVFCQRNDARPCDQSPAPLPAARVQPSAPFSVIGLDYAGPLYCLDFPGKKFYILLITCGVVRAIHLELTESLNLEDFMLGFRRFCARRGKPSVIYSDNARTFKGAASRMNVVFPVSPPDWRFIVPASPWWGGWWERLVRSVKSSLKRSLGRRSLTKAELETVLVEVEGCLNSRPLTTVDVNEPDHLLTPAHFLLGKMVHEQSRLEGMSSPLSDVDLKDLFEARADALGNFWRLWSDAYLKSLPPLVSRFRVRGAPKVGSVVMIRNDAVPRFQWPLGVIEETFRGRDGLIRSARVRTQRGSVDRAIQNLYDLEVSTCSDLSAEVRDGAVEQTRPRRNTRRPQRFCE